jgi:hypothetical protein
MYSCVIPEARRTVRDRFRREVNGSRIGFAARDDPMRLGRRTRAKICGWAEGPEQRYAVGPKDQSKDIRLGRRPNAKNRALLQIPAEPLDAHAGFLQRLIGGRVGNAEIGPKSES